ncbi:hypothetical protein ACFL1X_02830 [Candidatus Hydrogenedentota bacterium]
MPSTTNSVTKRSSIFTCLVIAFCIALCLIVMILSISRTHNASVREEIQLEKARLESSRARDDADKADVLEQDFLESSGKHDGPASKDSSEVDTGATQAYEKFCEHRTSELNDFYYAHDDWRFLKLKSVDDWTDEEVSQLRSFLEEHKDLLDLAVQAAEMGKLDLWLESDILLGGDESEWKRAQTILRAMRNSSELLKAASLLAYLDGNHGKALELCVKIIDIANQIPWPQKDFVAVDGRNAIVGSAMNCLMQIAPDTQPSEECIRALAEILAGSADRASAEMATALRRDRVVELFETLPSYLLLHSDKPKPALVRFRQSIDAHLYDRFLRDDDELFYLRFMNKIVEASKLPTHEALVVSGQILAEWRDLSYYFLEFELVELWIRKFPFSVPQVKEALRHILIEQAEYEAEIAVTRTALALILFERANGHYPDRLEALAPEYISSVPIDPCSGKPLIYHREEEGFLLYSVEKDDGGTPPKEHRRLDTLGDIVWQPWNRRLDGNRGEEGYTVEKHKLGASSA